MFARAIAISGLALAAPAAAVTVDLDATANGGASLNASFIEVALTAGDYDITAFSGSFEAWNPWGTVSGCTGAAECAQGFLVSYVIYDAGGTLVGSYGSLGTGEGYYATTAGALADAQAEGAYLFTAAADGSYFFGIGDNPLSDNSGGVSLSVEAASVSDVPLPAAAPLLLMGLGGLAALRRKG